MAERQSKLSFLDPLTRLFRRKEPEPAAAAPRDESSFEALRSDFETALRDLDRKAAECRKRAAASSSSSVGTAQRKQTAEERAAEELRRTQSAHRAIREDIEKAHARLQTGLENTDLTALAAYIEEVAATADAGRDSYDLLPRGRFAIAERLRMEAGELAAARLVGLLERAKLAWPDPTREQPSATPDEIERSRRRRRAETRDAFLAQGLRRTAERMLGVVKVWGSDYPDRGSPLWEESVFEGVAAGIRAQLVKECVELLGRDRDQVLARTEELIGKELGALHQALARGINSVEQANQAMASSLRVLDEVVPDLAWEHARAQLPHARGEWGD